MRIRLVGMKLHTHAGDRVGREERPCQQSFPSCLASPFPHPHVEWAFLLKAKRLWTQFIVQSLSLPLDRVTVAFEVPAEGEGGESRSSFTWVHCSKQLYSSLPLFNAPDPWGVRSLIVRPFHFTGPLNTVKTVTYCLWTYFPEYTGLTRSQLVYTAY